MVLRLTDLYANELRLMIRLDDAEHDESVGLSVDDLEPHEVAPLKRLMELGLVEETVGWRGKVWYRLTARGRQLRDEGVVG